nr:Chain C, PEPTIDE [Homo sapiens]
PRSFAA